MTLTSRTSGIVAEGGASVSFINRSNLAFLVPKFFLILILLIIVVGLGLANEVLILGKKKTAQELSDCGFAKSVKSPCPSAEPLIIVEQQNPP
jgi:peroxisomal 3,2-trans-enoyl-CoA isomerase